MLVYKWALSFFDRLRCLEEVEWKIVEKIYKAEGVMKTKQNTQKGWTVSHGFQKK